MNWRFINKVTWKISDKAAERLVFTSDGIGVVVRVVRALTT